MFYILYMCTLHLYYFDVFDEGLLFFVVQCKDYFFPLLDSDGEAADRKQGRESGA